MWHFGFKPPQICLSIPAHKPKDIYRVIRRYEKKADLFEVRLDWLRDWKIDDLGFLRDRPVLLTFRPERHGGHYRGSDTERFEVLFELAKKGLAQWVDLEHDTPLHVIEKFQPFVRILLSYHGYSSKSIQMLEPVFELLCEKPRDAIKVAVEPETFADVIVFLNKADHWASRCGDAVWVLMGEAYTWFRILSPIFGSLWTYASPDGTHTTTGKGQITLEELVQVYNFRDIQPDHILFGIVGHPISHSLSPYIHNLAFRELGIRGHYVAFDVDDLDAFWHLARYLPIRGLSVTIPHKEHVIHYVDRLDEHARRIGAANTLIRWENKTGAFNTDWSGFWRPLVRLTGRRSFRPLIIGAGGAARAVAYAFWSNRIPFLITNRTMERARAIARRFNGKAVEWNQIQPEQFDLLINATPVGMFPNHKECLPVPDDWLENHIVYDLVYRPLKTRLLMRARLVGAELTLDGLHMLVEQAWEQLKLWVNAAPPQDFLMATARAFIEKFDSTSSLF